MRTTGSDKPKLTDKRLGLLGQMPEVMGFSQGGCRLSNLPRDVGGGALLRYWSLRNSLILERKGMEPRA